MNIYKVNCFFQNNIFCVVHFLRFLCNSLSSWCISATLLVATLFYDVHFILSFFDFILSQSLKVSDHIFLWTYCFGFYDNHFTPGMAFSSLYDWTSLIGLFTIGFQIRSLTSQITISLIDELLDCYSIENAFYFCEKFLFFYF